ncbi:MAG: SHOCT domain-containing protein, partial [Candidatus Marinimicrobia bacterium]|nr:SHOCT domain-containing protein [Candidatus Neomarinimicrobiota bacterium]
RPNVKIKYGYHWCFTPWRNLYPRHNHNNVVVIKNEDKVLDDDSSDVFAKIEQLGALKESGLITEKEFQNAKKALLKRI